MPADIEKRLSPPIRAHSLRVIRGPVRRIASGDRPLPDGRSGADQSCPPCRNDTWECPSITAALVHRWLSTPRTRSKFAGLQRQGARAPRPSLARMSILRRPLKLVLACNLSVRVRLRQVNLSMAPASPWSASAKGRTSRGRLDRDADQVKSQIPPRPHPGKPLRELNFEAGQSFGAA